MPYKLEGKCVVKEDGEEVKCHDSIEDAKAHLAALNTNVPDAKKSVEEKCGYVHYVPMGAISFTELEAMQKAAETGRAVQDLTYQFERLVSNILYSDEINNKSKAIKQLTDEYTSRLDSVGGGADEKGVMTLDEWKAAGSGHTVESNVWLNTHEKSPIKREGGLDFPARDYAFVPDNARPASWKLRLTESPGKVTVSQLARAAAALSAGGFRGQKAQIPAAALSAVKRRIRAEFRKLGVPEEKIPPSVKKSFTVWKSADGQWRWMGVFSNNFRDRDNPPEILSEKAHQTFVGMVEKGIVSAPELQHWHIPNSKWGTGEVVGYDHGFTWIAGVIDPGHEKEAQAVSEMDDIRMSHGMPSRFIKRSADDSTVIDFYISTEVSSLPGWAAANELTEFSVFQGVSKMTDAQKEYLREANLSEDEITALASGFASKEQAAVDAGVERKEGTPPTDDKAKKKPPMKEEDTKPEDEEDEDKSVPVTAKALADAMGSVMKPLIAQIKSLNERVGGLESQIKEVQVFTDDQKELTPSASLESLMTQAIFGEPVDGRSKLAKSTPKAVVKGHTPVNFINNIMAEE